jgi:hypothetical protein
MFFFPNPVDLTLRMIAVGTYIQFKTSFQNMWIKIAELISSESADILRLMRPVTQWFFNFKKGQNVVNLALWLPC